MHVDNIVSKASLRVLLFLGHLLEQGFLPRCPVGMLLFYVNE